MQIKLLNGYLRKVTTIDDMQFGSMPVNGTIDAVFILRRIQEEYLDQENKLYMCFVDLERAFDKALMRNVEWAMRKTGIPEALVGEVMSLYKGVKREVKVGTPFSGELEYIRDQFYHHCCSAL